MGLSPPDVWGIQDLRPLGAAMDSGAALHLGLARFPVLTAELAEPVVPGSVSGAWPEEPLAMAVRTGRRNESSSFELIHLGLPSSFRPGLQVSPESRERHNAPQISCRRVVGGQLDAERTAIPAGAQTNGFL